MDFDDQSVKNFATYCRNGDYGSSVNIDQFENDYQPELAIWWYTYPSFVYSCWTTPFIWWKPILLLKWVSLSATCTVRSALMMASRLFFYRGQGLSTTDFETLRKTKGGLISFNNFLSTSRVKEVSLGYAMEEVANENTVGILFRMSIRPWISPTPFAAIQEISYLKQKKKSFFRCTPSFVSAK